MTRKSSWRILAVILGVVLFSATATGTTITGGRIIIEGITLTPDIVSGSFLAGWTGDLDLTPFLVVDIDNWDDLAARMCMPCHPGEVADIGWWGGGLYWYAPTASVGAEVYAPLYFSGHFQVHGQVKLPDPPIVDPSFTITDIPFTYLINLTAYANDPSFADPGPPVFRILVLGQGAAKVEFGSYPGNGILYEWRGATYDLFAGQAIPEPGTVVLVAAGLALVAARRVQYRRLRR